MLTLLMIFGVAALSLAVITIPDVYRIRLTTEPVRRKPNVAKVAVTNPGPMKVSATGASAAGPPLCEPMVGVIATLNGYYGYNIRPNVPLAPNDEQYSIVTGCIVDGFAGVVPGSPVWVDATAIPDPISTFSGLTHTSPGAGTPPVGLGVSTTKIDLYAF